MIQDISSEIIRLGPWAHEIEIQDGVSTRISLDAPPGTYPAELLDHVTFTNPREILRGTLSAVLPSGFEGRSFLDCACNGGGYVFAAKEMGAGRCFGFDAREHWIRQARFVLQHLDVRHDDVEFATCNLYDLPTRNLPRFDVTLFNGIFYHLPDPITGLQIAARLTDQLIIVNTAFRTGQADGSLALKMESVDAPLSGVDGLSWLPTGPQVVETILRWLGFVETRCLWQRETPAAGPGWGRMEVVGSKVRGLL